MTKPLRLSRQSSKSLKQLSRPHFDIINTSAAFTMERANIFHSNEKFRQRKLSSSHIVTALTRRKTFRSGTIIIRSISRHVQQAFNFRRWYVDCSGSQ